MIGEPPVDQKKMENDISARVFCETHTSILGTSTCKNISTCQLLVLSVGVHKRLLKGSLSHGV